jgi:hypothetical protein
MKKKMVLFTWNLPAQTVLHGIKNFATTALTGIGRKTACFVILAWLAGGAINAMAITDPKEPASAKEPRSELNLYKKKYIKQVVVKFHINRYKQQLNKPILVDVYEEWKCVDVATVSGPFMDDKRYDEPQLSLILQEITTPSLKMALPVSQVAESITADTRYQWIGKKQLKRVPVYSMSDVQQWEQQLEEKRLEKERLEKVRIEKARIEKEAEIAKLLEPHKKYIGQTIIRFHGVLRSSYPGDINGYYVVKQDEKWKCVNVAIASSDFVYEATILERNKERDNGPQVSLVLQNMDDPSIEKALPVTLLEAKEITEEMLTGGKKNYAFEHWWTTEEVILNELKREQEISDQYEQLKREEKAEEERREAERKQELIKKYGEHYGTKVFNREFVVGMTKAMCRDTGLLLFVASHSESRTASGKVETLVIETFTGAQVLIFVNDKLQSVDTDDYKIPGFFGF